MVGAWAKRTLLGAVVDVLLSPAASQSSGDEDATARHEFLRRHDDRAISRE